MPTWGWLSVANDARCWKASATLWKLRIVPVSSIFRNILPITTCRTGHSSVSRQKSAAVTALSDFLIVQSRPHWRTTGRSARNWPAGHHEFEGAKKEKNQCVERCGFWPWAVEYCCRRPGAADSCAMEVAVAQSCGRCEGDCGPTCGPVRRPYRERIYGDDGGGCSSCGARSSCGECGDDCGCCCQRNFCFQPLRWIGGLFCAGTWCGPSCGNTYWGEAACDPPDACEPCNRAGHWTGAVPGVQVAITAADRKAATYRRYRRAPRSRRMIR